MSDNEARHVKDFAEHLIRTKGPLTGRMVAVLYREQYHVGDRLDADAVETLLQDDGRLVRAEDGCYSLKPSDA